jgi:hypothetical protein
METTGEEWARWIADQEGEDSHHAILKDSPLHRAKRDLDRALAEIDRLTAVIAELEAERDIWQRDADEQMKLRLKAEVERNDAVQRDSVNAALTRAAIKKLEARIAALSGEGVT